MMTIDKKTFESVVLSATSSTAHVFDMLQPHLEVTEQNLKSELFGSCDYASVGGLETIAIRMVCLRTYYEQMWLEITNKINGQKRSYVITRNTSYTFHDLIDGTEWNAVVKNQRGDVFGRIETIEIGDNDTIVQFASLLKPQSVQLNVFEHDSTNVTSNVQITWLDNSNNYLHQGQSITKLPSGKQLKYGIILPQSLATKYKTPEVGLYIVNDSSNSISIVLDTVEQLYIQGRVKDEENNIAAIIDFNTSWQRAEDGYYYYGTKDNLTKLMGV